MEEKYPTAFSKMINLNSRTRLSINKKERFVVQILATNFHTKSAHEPGSGEEIRLNPIMNDLIMNGYADGYHMQASKSKRSKRQKKETKAEMVVGTGENQPDWLDTLKEEIANLK
jgi:hypothetical protein